MTVSFWVTDLCCQLSQLLLISLSVEECRINKSRVLFIAILLKHWQFSVLWTRQIWSLSSVAFSCPIFLHSELLFGIPQIKTWQKLRSQWPWWEEQSSSVSLWYSAPLQIGWSCVYLLSNNLKSLAYSLQLAVSPDPSCAPELAFPICPGAIPFFIPIRCAFQRFTFSCCFSSRVLHFSTFYVICKWQGCFLADELWQAFLA